MIAFSLASGINEDVKWSVNPVGSESTYQIDETTGMLTIAEEWKVTEATNVAITATYGESKKSVFYLTFVNGTYTSDLEGTASVGSYTKEEEKDDYIWALKTSDISSNDATITFTLKETNNDGFWLAMGICSSEENETYPVILGENYGTEGVSQYMKFSNGVFTLKTGTTADQLKELTQVGIVYTDLVDTHAATFKITITSD